MKTLWTKIKNEISSAFYPNKKVEDTSKINSPGVTIIENKNFIGWNVMTPFGEISDINQNILDGLQKKLDDINKLIDFRIRYNLPPDPELESTREDILIKIENLQSPTL